ncbi:MAG: hypothetical protein AAFW81_06630 [Pseudomonadota bacterium]
MADLELKSEDETKLRNRRNLAIALGLVAFVVLIFVVTILRLGGAVADRPL